VYKRSGIAAEQDVQHIEGCTVQVLHGLPCRTAFVTGAHQRVPQAPESAERKKVNPVPPPAMLLRKEKEKEAWKARAEAEGDVRLTGRAGKAHPTASQYSEVQSILRGRTG